MTRRLAQKLAGTLLLGRKARVDVFRMVADLLDAGFSLERALEIAARAAKDQGQRGRAQLLGAWRRALLEDRFADAVAGSLPASEAMIFHAYGRVDAAMLFAAAARVAEMRERQIAAVWKALAMPLVLALGPGADAVGRRRPLHPRHREREPARAVGLRRASLPQRLRLAQRQHPGVWRHAPGSRRGRHGRDGGLDRAGPHRSRQDRAFSLYRTLTGSAFLFVTMEFLAAGIDVNDRTFEALKRAASPYARHRIAAIQGHMARGVGLGRSMVLAGHGFPDPSLVPVWRRWTGRRGGRGSSRASWSAGWGARTSCCAHARRFSTGRF